MIGGGGGSALRGIGGAVGFWTGGGDTGAVGPVVGAVTQPASTLANTIASTPERIVMQRVVARIGMCREAMIGSDSFGMDGVEF